MSTFIYHDHFGANYTATVGTQPHSEPRSETMPGAYSALTIVLIILNFSLPLRSLVDSVVKYLPIQHWAFGYQKATKPFPSKRHVDWTLDRPEEEGFLPNQVTSHSITAPDGQSLPSWLILPLGAYAAQESVLNRSWSAEESREIALQMVRSDPQAVLVLYLHGNGSDITPEDRCAAYRNFSSIASKHVYLLSFNYRACRGSDGSFAEEHLTDDTLNVLSWVDKKLTVPRSKVLLVGHGMGCEVAVAAAQRVAEKDRYAEYAGLLLCACLTNNVKPTATPWLRRSVDLRALLAWNASESSVIEQEEIDQTWKIEQRLKGLVRRCEVLRISILQAEDDECTPYSVAEGLYRSCRSEVGKSETVIETQAVLGAAGDLKEFRGGDKMIRRVIFRHGGHNNLMQWSTVAFEAARLLTAAGAID